MTWCKNTSCMANRAGFKFSLSIAGRRLSTKRTSKGCAMDSKYGRTSELPAKISGTFALLKRFLGSALVSKSTKIATSSSAPFSMPPASKIISGRNSRIRATRSYISRPSSCAMTSSKTAPAPNAARSADSAVMVFTKPTTSICKPPPALLVANKPSRAFG